jgi:hypothetical protein
MISGGIRIRRLPLTIPQRSPGPELRQRGRRSLRKSSLKRVWGIGRQAVESTCAPGAAMSTLREPKFEKPASRSVCVDAATQTMFTAL